jgi:hypothetical protein
MDWIYLNIWYNISPYADKLEKVLKTLCTAPCLLLPPMAWPLGPNGLLGFQLVETTITNALLHNGSTLSMVSIRMINVQHTKLETHGG